MSIEQINIIIIIIISLHMKPHFNVNKCCDWWSSCRTGPPISQLTVASPVILGGPRPQLATHHAGLDHPCTDQLMLSSDDDISWRRHRTVYIAAKTDFKIDGNQTSTFRLVLRKIIGANVERRTLCSYKVRQQYINSFMLLSYFTYNTIHYKTCNAPYVTRMLFVGAGIRRG